MLDDSANFGHDTDPNCANEDFRTYRKIVTHAQLDLLQDKT